MVQLKRIGKLMPETLRLQWLLHVSSQWRPVNLRAEEVRYSAQLYERERSLKNIHWKRSERNLTCSIYFALRPFRCWW